MTSPQKRPGPDDPSTWTVPVGDDDGDESQVDLRLSLDDEHFRERAAPSRQATGPMPAAASPPTGDGLKIAGGTASMLAVLALVDKVLEGAGLTASELAQHLGPMLGTVYMTSPILGVLMFLTWLLLRGYRREQSDHRRRNHRMQEAFLSLGRGIKSKLEKLQSDIRRVEERFESRVAEAVSVAAQAATLRADRTDSAIAELRAGQVQINQRLAVIDPPPPHDVVRPRRRTRET